MDELSPTTAEPGTRLSFQGEGYYGPLTVKSGDFALANPTAISHAIAFADTVSGQPAGPLTLRTLYGSTRTAVFTPAATRPALTEQMLSSVPLTSIGAGLAPVIIPEARFLALRDTAQATTPLLQAGAATLVSASSQASALGLFATPGAGTVTGDVFIVARDWRLGPTGAVETRDYYLVAAHLTGYSEFAALPALAFSSDLPSAPQCDAVGRGCHPLLTDESGAPRSLTNASPAAAGLPPTVTLNLEAPPSQLNGSGLRPQLRVFGRQGTAIISNSFTCSEQVLVEACGVCSSTGGGDLPGSGTHDTTPASCRLATPKNLHLQATAGQAVSAGMSVVVLRESEFKASRAQGQP